MIFQKYQNLNLSKGHLILKANSQAKDSPKKRTNEFIFTSMRHVFVRFLGESSARTKTFRDYLTFKICTKIVFNYVLQYTFLAQYFFG